MPTPFAPHQLPLESLDYARLIGPASEARAALAAYDARLSSLENPALMLSPLTTQEAVLSSRIEGTQATLEDVLGHDAGQLATGEKERDIQEIVNYRAAMGHAYAYLQDMPISLWLIRQMHQTLLDSTRGENKLPGSFRNSEVIIGPPGARDRSQASFIPPEHEFVSDHMQAWVDYVNFKDREPLIQTAIIHAQFEIIHPFLDGNGRIGRLLIPLYLYQRRILSSPMFYISGYLETYREQYYAGLRGISDSENWDGWIEFFLRAVTTQANDNSTTLMRIADLRRRMEDAVFALTQSKYSHKAVTAIFSMPIFTSGVFAELAEMSKQSATRFLRLLKSSGILHVRVPASGRTPEQLIYPDLVSLISRGNALMSDSIETIE